MDRFAFCKELLGDCPGVGVEIGTCWGGFADFLAKNTNLSILYCVDPYRKFPVDLYCDALNLETQEALDYKFEYVSQRLSETGKVCMIRDTSYEAKDRIPDELDFVYIDGNHHYNEVLKDLVCWWPKVKKGGLLCGDDVESIDVPHRDGDVLIEHSPGSFGVYGVATALRDFQKVCPSFSYTILENQFWARK